MQLKWRFLFNSADYYDKKFYYDDDDNDDNYFDIIMNLIQI